MRSRKEIANESLKNIDKYSEAHGLYLNGLLIELLLDIRDQNEIMISQLNSMKKYSATSDRTDIPSG